MKIWYKIALLDNKPWRHMFKQQTTACYTIGMASIVGGRQSQQDSYQLICLDQEGNRTILRADDPVTMQNSSRTIIAALTDGVGGQVAGDIAALLAAETFTESVEANLAGNQNIKSLMLDAVSDANLALDIAIKSNKDYAGMATTLVGIVVNDKGLNWLSVGDSHLYLVRNQELDKLNADHSMGAVIDHEYATGKISHEEALNAPYRNVILSCLSGKAIELIDIYDSNWELKAGDKLILSSDGLDTLRRDEILEIMMQQSDPQDCANALTQAVENKQRDYQDNTTIVVVNYNDLQR